MSAAERAFRFFVPTGDEILASDALAAIVQFFPQASERCDLSVIQAVLDARRGSNPLTIEHCVAVVRELRLGEPPAPPAIVATKYPDVAKYSIAEIIARSSPLTAEEERLRADMIALLRERDPEALHNLPKWLVKNRGQWKALLEHLRDKHATEAERIRAAQLKRLMRFYERYCPERAYPEYLLRMLDKYAGRESELFSALRSRYGPEPVVADSELSADELADTQRQLVFALVAQPSAGKDRALRTIEQRVLAAHARGISQQAFQERSAGVPADFAALSAAAAGESWQSIAQRAVLLADALWQLCGDELVAWRSFWFPATATESASPAAAAAAAAASAAAASAEAASSSGDSATIMRDALANMIRHVFVSRCATKDQQTAFFEARGGESAREFVFDEFANKEELRRIVGGARPSRRECVEAKHLFERISSAIVARLRDGTARAAALSALDAQLKQLRSRSPASFVHALRQLLLSLRATSSAAQEEQSLADGDAAAPSAKQAAVPSAPASIADIVTSYFERFAPHKLGAVESVVARFAGREQQLIEALEAKWPSGDSAIIASKNSVFFDAATSMAAADAVVPPLLDLLRAVHALSTGSEPTDAELRERVIPNLRADSVADFFYSAVARMCEGARIDARSPPSSVAEALVSHEAGVVQQRQRTAQQLNRMRAFADDVIVPYAQLHGPLSLPRCIRRDEPASPNELLRCWFGEYEQETQQQQHQHDAAAIVAEQWRAALLSDSAIDLLGAALASPAAMKAFMSDVLTLPLADARRRVARKRELLHRGLAMIQATAGRVPVDVVHCRLAEFVCRAVCASHTRGDAAAQAGDSSAAELCDEHRLETLVAALEDAAAASDSSVVVAAGGDAERALARDAVRYLLAPPTRQLVPRELSPAAAAADDGPQPTHSEAWVQALPVAVFPVDNKSSLQQHTSVATRIALIYAKNEPHNATVIQTLQQSSSSWSTVLHSLIQNGYAEPPSGYRGMPVPEQQHVSRSGEQILSVLDVVRLPRRSRFAAAAGSSSSPSTLPIRERLINFYQMYNPAKLEKTHLERCVDAYGHAVDTLFDLLVQRYGPEPGIAAPILVVAAATDACVPSYEERVARLLYNPSTGRLTKDEIDSATTLVLRGGESAMAALLEKRGLHVEPALIP